MNTDELKTAQIDSTDSFRCTFSLTVEEFGNVLGLPKTLSLEITEKIYRTARGYIYRFSVVPSEPVKTVDQYAEYRKSVELLQSFLDEKTKAQSDT